MSERMARRRGRRVRRGRPEFVGVFAVGAPGEGSDVGASAAVGVSTGADVPTGKNFAIPSGRSDGLIDLPYDFGVLTGRDVLLS